MPEPLYLQGHRWLQKPNGYRNGARAYVIICENCGLSRASCEHFKWECEKEPERLFVTREELLAMATIETPFKPTTLIGFLEAYDLTLRSIRHSSLFTNFPARWEIPHLHRVMRYPGAHSEYLTRISVAARTDDDAMRQIIFLINGAPKLLVSNRNGRKRRLIPIPQIIDF